MTELLGRQHKVLAIMDAVISAATAIVAAVKEIPRHKLPRIAKAARRRRAVAMRKVYFGAFVGSAQVEQVASQPVPKYYAGAPALSNTLAIVGDDNREEVILPADGRKLSVPRVSLPKEKPLSNHKFIGKNIIWLREDDFPDITMSENSLSLFNLIDYVEGKDYIIEEGDGVRTRIYNFRRILLSEFIIDPNHDQSI